MKKKECIFVLGMHRSGTSALAGCFHILGANIGKTVMPPSFDNPKGFYENQLIVNINEELLGLYDASWDEVVQLPPDWLNNPSIDELKTKAKNIIKTDFDDVPLLLIKDPRICIFFPFWESVLKELKINVRVAIITRHPGSVAQSLHKRNKLPYNKSYLLWQHYLYSAEIHTKNVPRCFTTFRELLEHPISAVTRCLKELGLDTKILLDEGNHIIQYIGKSHRLEAKHPEYILEEIEQAATKLFEASEELSKNKENTAIDFFDESRQHFYKTLDFYLYGAVKPEKPVVTYVLKEGHKVLDIISQPVALGATQVNLNLNAYPTTTTIEFYPSNQIAYAKVDKVLLNENSFLEVIEVKKNNILLEHGNEFVLHKQSYFVFDIDTYHLKSIQLDINYKAFNKKVYKNIQLLGDTIKEWFYNKTQAAENEKNNTKLELQDVQTQLSNAKEELKNKASSNHTLKNTLTATTEKNKTLTLQNKDLNTQVKTLTNELKTVNEQIIQKDTMIHQEQKEKERLRLEFSTLKKEHSKRKKELEQIVLELNSLLDEKQAYLQTIERQQEQLTQKERTILKQELEVEKQAFYLDQYKEKLTDKEALIQTIQAEKKTLEDKLTASTNLVFTKDQALQQLKRDIQSLQEKHTALQELLQKIFAELAEKEQTVVQKANQIYQLHEKLQILSQNLDLKDAIVKEKIAELKHIQTQTSHQQTHTNDQQTQLAVQSKQLDTLKSLLQSSEELIHNQYNEINQLRQSLTDLDKNYTDLRSSLSFKTGWTATAPFRWIYNFINKDKPVNESKLWLWMQFLSSSVSQPGAFVKNINAKNIKTLRLALTNEKPEEIASNLKKLLNGQTSTSDTENKPIAETIAVEQNNSLLETTPASNLLSKQIKEVTEPTSSNFPRSKVLYISPNLPDYDTSSGGKRATRMLELLAQDCDVYAFTLGSAPDKYVQKLSEIGVIVIRTTDYNQIRRRIHHIDAIIYAWYYTYFDANRFTELYPDAKIIVDSVDVHWVRESRSIGIWEGLTQEKVDANKKRELESYRNADIIWAVTENDKNAIIAEIPDADVRVVSNIHSHVKDKYEDSNNNNLLFIGGFNHYPNISAVKLLTSNVFPKIRKQIPDATLTIAGANAPEEVQELGKLPGVIFKGFIEEEDMDALYQNAFATISPLLAGAGIKGKICESISYRTPVITNAIGNEGIGLKNLQDGIITDDYDEMANLTVRALKREFNMDEMTQRAQQKLHGLVGPDIVKQRMLSSILPEVSICIVTWNRLELLKRCIESVEGNTKYPYYKIIVHSNGCEDGTQQYLEAAAKINPRIVPVLSKTNDVFVIPNNKMMMMFPDNDVVLLNNDTYVTPNWLSGLYEAAYSSSDIGIAGSKIMYPDGRLQEFGSELYENGSGRNIGKWDENPNKAEYSKQTAVGYVSGCSMYIKRSTIKQIGVFDEQFHPCYCEDSDYCYTAWKHKIQTVVTPKSVIYHDEGGTSGTDTSKGFKKYQDVNFKKFLKKHKANLSGIAETIKRLN